MLASCKHVADAFRFVLLCTGVGVKVYLVDMVEESISPPFTVRVYLQQTVAALKDQVASHLSCNIECIRCVLDVHSDLRLLDEPERSLKLVGFGKNNKVVSISVAAGHQMAC